MKFHVSDFYIDADWVMRTHVKRTVADDSLCSCNCVKTIDLYPRPRFNHWWSNPDWITVTASYLVCQKPGRMHLGGWSVICEALIMKQRRYNPLALARLPGVHHYSRLRFKIPNVSTLEYLWPVVVMQNLMLNKTCYAQYVTQVVHKRVHFADLSGWWTLCLHHLPRSASIQLGRQLAVEHSRWSIFKYGIVCEKMISWRRGCQFSEENSELTFSFNHSSFLHLSFKFGYFVLFLCGPCSNWLI